MPQAVKRWRVVLATYRIRGSVVVRTVKRNIRTREEADRLARKLCEDDKCARSTNVRYRRWLVREDELSTWAHSDPLPGKPGP